MSDTPSIVPVFPVVHVVLSVAPHMEPVAPVSGVVAGGVVAILVSHILPSFRIFNGDFVQSFNAFAALSWRLFCLILI